MGSSSTATPTDAEGNIVNPVPGNNTPTSTDPSDPTQQGPALPSNGQGPDGEAMPSDTTVPADVAQAVADAKPLTMTLDGEPIFARAVRLTHSQWELSVRYLLQLDGPTGQVEGLTADALGVHDFSNNEINLEVGPKLWADYEVAAEALANQVATSDAALAKIYSGTDAAGFISSFGRRAFRRPLTDAELTSYQAIYDAGAALTKGGSTEFARGAGLVIEAMLQSPNFLYRTEMQGSGSRLNGYEIAAKLSLLLKGVTPDDALLDAAAKGDLDTDDGVMTTASTMMDDPAAIDIMRQFHGEMYRFNRFASIEKDTSVATNYTTDLNPDLEESSYRFFDDIYSSSLGVRDILLGNKAYVSPAMAKLYGITMTGTGFQQVELPAERPGYFTQLPFLILNSVNMVPDSIHRGVSLNHDVLCAPVPPPTVAGVMLPKFVDGQSNRERVEAGTGKGTCGESCHGTYINPLGFAFENFDGMGQERDMDNGNPVDTQSSYPFVEGNVAFDGAPDLMQKIADGSQVHLCYAKHLAGFALQRDLATADKTFLDGLAQASSGQAASVKQMLLSVVTNSAFTTRTSGDVQ
jgi:hypothetical protein